MCWVYQRKWRIWKQREKWKENCVQLRPALTTSAPPHPQHLPKSVPLRGPSCTVSVSSLPAPRSPFVQEGSRSDGMQFVWQVSRIKKKKKPTKRVFWQLHGVKSFLTSHLFQCFCLTWEVDNKAGAGTTLCGDSDGQWEKRTSCFSVRHYTRLAQGAFLEDASDKPGAGEQQHGTFSPSGLPASNPCVPKVSWAVASAVVSLRRHQSQTASQG